MRPVGRRQSLLWGLTGALSFLVALQAYELLAEVRVDWAVKFGVAAAMGLTAAAIAPRVHGLVANRNGQV